MVLYDADCGFCRWSLDKVLAWDRRDRLEPVALQSQRGRELTADLGEEQRMASWHLVSGGHRDSGGAAIPPLLELLPGGKPPARVLARLPGLTDRGYRFVAGHRDVFGRLVSRTRGAGRRKAGPEARPADRARRS